MNAHGNELQQKVPNVINSKTIKIKVNFFAGCLEVYINVKCLSKLK